MSPTADSYLADMPMLCSAIDQADAVLIGAGAGLSTAAGLLYLDPATFQYWFPGYHEKYGLRHTYEACFFEFPSTEEYYAFWARHISTVRFHYPPGKPYLDLHSIVKGRNYFVLTTNVDGQFMKSGFDPRRTCTPQGDFAYFQCSRPCSEQLWPNEDIIKSLLIRMEPGSFAIRSEDIPRCPHCGSLLEPNIRQGANFVEPPWMKKYAELDEFLRRMRSGRLLLLELGVGFNTPSIIRYPFERLAATRKDSVLIRVNREEVTTTFPHAALRTRAYSVDAGAFLASLAAATRVRLPAWGPTKKDLHVLQVPFGMW